MRFEDEIYELAARLAPAGTEETVLRMLCRAAERELRSRLRPGLREEEYTDALICAAAWIAAGSLGRSGGNAKSFSVGDVSVTTGSSGDERMRRLADQLMAPYVKDSFAFREV